MGEPLHAACTAPAGERPARAARRALAITCDIAHLLL